MRQIPSSLIFVCTKNSIRSPMAEALTKHLMAKGCIPRAYVDSAGVDPGDIDGFAVAVMSEIDIDVQRHESKGMRTLSGGEFDLIIALSKTAEQEARELVKSYDSTVEFWSVEDPSLTEGHRDARIEAYRSVRDDLQNKILQRFSL